MYYEYLLTHKDELKSYLLLVHNKTKETKIFDEMGNRVSNHEIANLTYIIGHINKCWDSTWWNSTVIYQWKVTFITLSKLRDIVTSFLADTPSGFANVAKSYLDLGSFHCCHRVFRAYDNFQREGWTGKEEKQFIEGFILGALSEIQ